ncbi:hypothetical protein QYE76_059570 [Lolium multiflorum]|uniref:Uncharacterized protein n=1 Tax=Lolium multiflorum TaxID=4521 RepID=A0AAD8W4L3_LOLMU|nr:hypothetical protein QYE76_059570 [Lolium multiflorum]
MDAAAEGSPGQQLDLRSWFWTARLRGTEEEEDAGRETSPRRSASSRRQMAWRSGTRERARSRRHRGTFHDRKR